MNEEDKPTHLDIFSGIGGFAIAAQWAGFETVAFCESDPRCRAFLEKRWGLTVHPDIRTFDAKPYAGVSLLTGGPPCQPASRAGQQGGEGDERWLWPEALRVLKEAKPDSVVFENPPGILDVGIDGILSEMGGLGYEVQCFDIPACAVDSPQLRHRIWIVGFRSLGDTVGVRTKLGRETGDMVGAGCEVEGEARQRKRRRNTTLDSSPASYVADAAWNGEGGIRTATRTDCERVGQPCEPDSGKYGRRPMRAKRARRAGAGTGWTQFRTW